MLDPQKTPHTPRGGTPSVRVSRDVPPFRPPFFHLRSVKNTPVGYHFFVLSHPLWEIFMKFSYLATLFGSSLLKKIWYSGWGLNSPSRYSGWGENSPHGPLTPTRLRAKCPVLLCDLSVLYTVLWLMLLKDNMIYQINWLSPRHK